MNVCGGRRPMWEGGVRHALRVEGSLLLRSKLVGASPVLYHGLQGLLNDAVIAPRRTLSIGDVLVVENLRAYHALDALR